MSVQWIKQYEASNSTLEDTNPSIVVDSTGNTYVAYQTSGTVSGGTLKGSTDIVVFKMDTNGNVTWVKQQTVMNTSLSDTIPSIAVDSAGNTYIAYQTSGTVSGGTKASGSDIVVFKMDTNGNVLWIKQQTAVNAADGQVQSSIAVDSSRNIYVAYRTIGTVSGGTTAGSGDIAVFKMDTNGNVTWIKQQTVMNTTGHEYVPSIAVNSTGIYVAYQTYGTVSGGTTAGSGDIAVFKMDATGNVLWVKQHTAVNALFESVPSIVVDTNGNTYVAYQTSGTVSGGTTAGGNDIAVFKMDTDGNITWVKQQTVMNTSLTDGIPSIAVDSNNNIYVAYQTSGTVSGGTTAGNSDIVVFKMDANGDVTRITQQTAFNTSATDSISMIGVDSNNNIYVAYQTDGTVSGGTKAGGTDIVVFKMAFPLPPAAPTIIANPTIVSPTSIQYNWTALPSLTYTITLTDGTTSVTQSALSVNNATFTNLIPGTSYTATIYATDAYNQISPTSTYTTVPLGILPLAPAIKRNPQVTSTSIKYYLTPSPNINSYTVTLSSETGSGTGTQILSPSAQICTFNNLSPGATYTATIFATDSFNQNGPVATYNTVQSCNRPGPPTNVNFTASNGMLTVKWGPPSDDGGSPIQGYVIRDTNRTRALTFGVEAFRREYTVAIPSGTYRFQIAAVNFAGHGTPVVSNQLTF